MSILKDKKILITGGTGFVGSHLVEELLREKSRVITTFQTLNPFSYFMTQKFNNKVIMINVDICDFGKVFNIVTKFKIDYIFHLAAQPLVEVAYVNPRQTLYSNILGTVNILECARLYPQIKGVIVSSSDKAYGKLTKEKYVETDFLQGDHPYEVSKSSADLIANSYFKTYGIPVSVARFGNIYGEGDLNYSRIIPGIMRSLINKEILELRSDGSCTRDYIYVKDVVKGYILLLKNIEKTKGEAYNFGSNDNFSVFKLISMIGKKLKTKVPYRIVNTAKNEILYQALDYEKIREIGWRPKQSFNTAIYKVFKWYSRVLK